MNFHLAFIFTFTAFTLIRMVYHHRAKLTRGKVVYKEGRLHIGLRKLVGIPFIISLLIYMVSPTWFVWGSLDLPEWGRWLGVALGVLSLPLIGWIQWALGSNFSATLHVRDEHTLVTHGPYRWVRHPMYTAIFIHLTGLLLLSANWYIGGVPLAALALIVATRINNEERVMLEKFGDHYRHYIQHTGRFFPRVHLGLQNGD